MKRDITILVALDGEVDRGLVETIVARDPSLAVLDYLELGGPVSSGLGTGDALVIAVADYTVEAREFVVAARRQHGNRPIVLRSEEHTSELQSLRYLVCRLLLENKNTDWSSGMKDDAIPLRLLCCTVPTQ